MVAQITEGTAFDKRGRPFRRRNHRPAIIVFAVMFVITAIIWVIALTRPNQVHEAVACNPPPAADPSAPRLGTQVSRSTMTEVAPARLVDTKIRVLNASGQGGQAGDVAGALRDLGFGQPTAANDPIYANTRLTCQGQLRFGTAGQAAAAAVWLVAPCMELFQDQRPDDTVDLALGTEFTTLAHSDAIDATLATLRPDATAPPDLSLLSEIHSNAC
ncbi:envelope integrity protein Cei [Mycobacterium sp.]|uniref:envelope integrity protein Cei n=1 Tax=Mycobacterium sp. TaxID=1785 RepID=UPI002D3954D3|nr:envelope integrity protein Cei [Mycobacterium sp.]HZA09125.1 envelope integrity protein Cei [Mycobacterium sp.]